MPPEASSLEYTSGKLGLLDRPLVQVLILILCAALAYANTFHVPFLFDDETAIVENPVVHGLGNFFRDNAGYTSLPNRFVGYLTFALNYHIGGTNVVGYHVFNLLIHMTNGLLVYFLAAITLRTPLVVRHCTPCRHHSLLPMLAGLLFVVHPVQTQAVTYIVQRLTSLAALFFLLALLLHVRWRIAHHEGSTFVSRAVLPWFVLSVSAAILAMKTKEIAFTLPFTVLLYEAAFFGFPSRATFVKLVPMLLTASIIPVTLLNLSKPVGQLISDVHSATAVQTSLSRGDYLYTQFNVIVTYLRLLVFPVQQNLDYDYPVSRSVLEPRTMASLFLLVAIVALAFWLWRKGAASDYESLNPAYARLAAFGIFWFFLTLAVESSFIPIIDVIFEHRVYLPSVGFFLALVSLVLLTAEKVQSRFSHALKTALGILVALSIVFVGATYARNTVWREPVTLWQDVKSKSPGKARPYVNLGTYFGEQERIEDSLREFEAAVRIDPMEPHALSNLVLLYLVSGRPAQAREACTNLHKADPTMAGVFKLYEILRMPDDGNPAFQAVREVCGAFSSLSR